MNNASDIVGWGYYEQGVTSCREAALLWVEAAVTNLHECWTGNESRAESINGDGRIVGFDPAGTALRWTPDQGQSCGYLIENLDDGASCGAEDADLSQALRITEQGWIVANGTVSGAAEASC